eukprot:2066-Chlamydomonas_euryale.AAC.2
MGANKGRSCCADAALPLTLGSPPLPDVARRRGANVFHRDTGSMQPAQHRAQSCCEIACGFTAAKAPSVNGVLLDSSTI